MLKEVVALARLCDTPNIDLSSIVRYYGAWEESGTLYCQMELCDGTLTRVIYEDRGFVNNDDEKVRGGSVRSEASARSEATRWL